MKRSLFTIVFIISLVFSLSGSFHPVQAGFPTASPDLDQDGILNSLETDGWYNLTGGPYVTDPNDADSDHDGLTDAEEKLFNTNPNDLQSPGISVKYESNFKTFEYYRAGDPRYLAMVQGGDRYLLTEGLVVRRGTAFTISAVNSSTATLTLNGSGLTPITPVRDPARGGWRVSIPAGGTAGLYTATIVDGAFSKSMPIYVIFELPTDMTQAQIDAYLYDDDPANNRDEVAVWWRAIDWKYYNVDSVDPTPCEPSDPVCSSWQYHTISTYAQAFWTEQFTKNVLQNFTIPAIHDTTNTLAAARAIGALADQSVRVNFSSVKNSFSNATTYYESGDPAHQAAPFRMDGGACETQAGVYTSILRSAGIASRPFVMDYNRTPGHDEGIASGVFEYDHAVMMWVNSTWYAARTFNAAEPEFVSSPTWTNGAFTGLFLLENWRTHFRFQDYFSDAVQSANEGWDFQNGSLGGGMVNTEWTGIDVPGTDFTFVNRDMKWNSKRPLEIQQSPYVDIFNCQLWMGDDWAPSEWRDPPVSNPEGRNALQTYFLPAGVPSGPTDIENWPYNPRPTSCSDSTSVAACDAFRAAWQAACAPLPGQTFANPQLPASSPVQPAAADLNTSIQLGEISGDAGQDWDADGRFDELVVQFDLSSSLAGDYQIGGWLKVGEKLIPAEASQVTLVVGQQSLSLSFNGQVIGNLQIDGPYQVQTIWVAPAGQVVSKLALPDEMSAYRDYSYDSQPYDASKFMVRPATMAGSFSYSSADNNANGLVDSITISVPLNIVVPGNFKVEGDLYDGQGGFVGHAEWNGSDPVASLEYQVALHQPPYSLQHLNLFDDNGRALDSRYAPVYKIDDLNNKVDLGSIILENQSPAATLQSITLTSTPFTIAPVDLNGNSRADQLVVSAAVNVTDQGGNYWMEGLLVDNRGIPAAWSVGSIQTLGVGQNQALRMVFDGRQLFDQIPLTTGQSFSLVAVKIFSGSPAQAVLELNLPITNFQTPTYLRSQLERSMTGAVFEDDMENGETKWSRTGAWTLTTAEWNSGSHAYRATGTGRLTIANPINLSAFTNAPLALKFRYAHNLGATNEVQLQVSTGGGNWTTLRTFTGLTDYWTTALVDLEQYRGLNSVEFRFNIPTATGSMQWYVDDVFIITGPYTTYLPFTVRR